MSIGSEYQILVTWPRNRCITEQSKSNRLLPVSTGVGLFTQSSRLGHTHQRDTSLPVFFRHDQAEAVRPDRDDPPVMSNQRHLAVERRVGGPLYPLDGLQVSVTSREV